jgi:predicted PurR-regulated permease PerM
MGYNPPRVYSVTSASRDIFTASATLLFGKRRPFAVSQAATGRINHLTASIFHQMRIHAGNTKMRLKGLTKFFFILILFIVTLAFFNILSPWYSAILWAAILAVIFYPLKNKLRTRLAGRNGLASVLTVGIICLIVFTPLAVILSSLAFEINLVYSKLQHNDTQFPAVIASLINHLPQWARHLLAEHNLDSAEQIQRQLSSVALKGGQYLAGSAFLIGKGTFGFTISFGVMLYLLFFLLKDGPWLVRVIMESLPLSGFVKRHLFAKFAAVARATVKGTAVVALVQGCLAASRFILWALTAASCGGR